MSCPVSIILNVVVVFCCAKCTLALKTVSFVQSCTQRGWGALGPLPPPPPPPTNNLQGNSTPSFSMVYYCSYTPTSFHMQWMHVTVNNKQLFNVAC